MESVAQPPNPQEKSTHTNLPLSFSSRILIVVLVVIFILALSTLVFKFTAKKDKTDNKSSPITSATAIPGWKTYTNSFYKYSFSYPSMYSFKANKASPNEADGKESRVFIVEDDPSKPYIPLITINVMNPKDTAKNNDLFESYYKTQIDTLLKADIGDKITLSVLTIGYTRLPDEKTNDYNARVFESYPIKENASKSPTNRILLIEKDNLIYSIQSSYEQKSGNNWDTYNQIVKSFTLL